MRAIISVTVNVALDDGKEGIVYECVQYARADLKFVQPVSVEGLARRFVTDATHALEILQLMELVKKEDTNK